MAAVWAFVVCVLTVWINKGLTLPVGGTNERHDNELQRRMIRDVSPNDISMKRAFALLKSMESKLIQAAKAQLKTNEVEAEVAFQKFEDVQLPLNGSKQLKTRLAGFELSTNQTPGNQTPGNQTPGNQTPGNQTPGNQTPEDVQLPLNGPKQLKTRLAGFELSGNQTPGNQTPGNQTPGNQTPGNQTPGNQTPEDVQLPLNGPKQLKTRLAGFELPANQTLGDQPANQTSVPSANLTSVPLST